MPSGMTIGRKGALQHPRDGRLLNICGQKKQEGVSDLCLRPRDGEIIVYVREKRDAKMAKNLRRRLLSFGGYYDAVVQRTNWDIFEKVFADDRHLRDKEYTKGIEGNNCRLRHRKVFEAGVFFYINFTSFLLVY